MVFHLIWKVHLLTLRESRFNKVLVLVVLVVWEAAPAESKMMSFGRIFCMKGDLVRRLATQLVKM
jgi:hypothetical protein